MIEPPHSPEAEQSVLGALLVRPHLLDEVVQILEPEDFYRQAHGTIYRAMLGLYNQDKPVDLVTVTMRLKEVGVLEAVGGPVFLAGLSEQVGFAVNATYYAELVRDKALLRRLLDATQEIGAACLAPVEDAGEFLDAVEEKIYQLRERGSPQRAAILDDLVVQELERLEDTYNRKGETVGVPSGFIDLDSLVGGWMGGDLIILASRPGMGKTALALNMAIKSRTLFFSLEQPKEQLVQRILSSAGEIDGQRLRTARLTQDDWAKVHSTAGSLLGTSLFVVDTPAMTTMEIRAESKRMLRTAEIQLIIVDYLQLVKAKASRSREQEIGEVARFFKALAKELKLPVVALAQLNRKVEDRPNKRPQLADLRESGAIEQEADLVIFIYRDEVYRENSPDAGIAEIRVAKNRNGPLGVIKLTFRKEITRFYSHITI
jgi:replicative DNA helicase